jgi:PAS domain S-box-containing protein
MVDVAAGSIHAPGQASTEAGLIAALRALFDEAPDLMSYWDRDLVLRWANRAFGAALGRPVEALLGQARGDLFPAWRDRLPEWRRQVAVEGWSKVVIEETPLPGTGGRARCWTVVDTAVRSAGGDLAGIVTIAHDVTEQVADRKWAEADRRRLRAIIDAVPARISVWDRDGRELLMNAAAEACWRRLGCPSVRAGAPVAGVYYPDGRPVPPEELPIWQVYRTGRPVQGRQLVFRLPDGREEPALVSATPLFDPDGRLDGAVALGFDLRPELERQELARRAEAMEALARLKTRLLASVSHELRTPLSHINGAVETLLRQTATLEPAEQIECLELIRAATAQLQRRISDLLDASQIETGQLPLTLEPVEAPAIAGRVVERLRRLAPERQVTLAFAPAFPPVLADAGRLEQVLENLIGNALHHAPGARISIGGRARRSEIELWVRDDGPGLPPARRDRLFEPLAGARRPAGGGLGLGLAICRGIVEAHGGRIWAAPRRRGLAVHFTLPRRRAPGRRALPQPAAAGEAAGERATLPTPSSNALDMPRGGPA